MTRATYPRSASQLAQRYDWFSTPAQPWNWTTAGNGPGPSGRTNAAAIATGAPGVTFGNLTKLVDVAAHPDSCVATAIVATSRGTQVMAQSIPMWRRDGQLHNRGRMPPDGPHRARGKSG